MWNQVSKIFWQIKHVQGRFEVTCPVSMSPTFESELQSLHTPNSQIVKCQMVRWPDSQRVKQLNVECCPGGRSAGSCHRMSGWVVIGVTPSANWLYIQDRCILYTGIGFTYRCKLLTGIGCIYRCGWRSTGDAANFGLMCPADLVKQFHWIHKPRKASHEPHSSRA